MELMDVGIELNAVLITLTGNIHKYFEWRNINMHEWTPSDSRARQVGFIC